MILLESYGRLLGILLVGNLSYVVPWEVDLDLNFYIFVDKF